MTRVQNILYYGVPPLLKHKFHFQVSDSCILDFNNGICHFMMSQIGLADRKLLKFEPGSERMKTSDYPFWIVNNKDIFIISTSDRAQSVVFIVNTILALS